MENVMLNGQESDSEFGFFEVEIKLENAFMEYALKP